MPVSSINQSTILLPRTARPGVALDNIGREPDVDTALDSLDGGSVPQLSDDLSATTTVIPSTALNEALDRRANIADQQQSESIFELDSSPVSANAITSFVVPVDRPSSTSQVAIDLYSQTQRLLSDQTNSLFEPGQALVGVDIFV